MKELNGGGIKYNVSIDMSVDIETYNIFCFLEALILRRYIKICTINMFSIIPQGISKKFTNPSFGVLNAVQILLQTSIIIQNLH